MQQLIYHIDSLDITARRLAKDCCRCHGAYLFGCSIHVFRRSGCPFRTKVCCAHNFALLLVFAGLSLWSSFAHREVLCVTGYRGCTVRWFCSADWGACWRDPCRTAPADRASTRTCLESESTGWRAARRLARLLQMSWRNLFERSHYTIFRRSGRHSASVCALNLIVLWASGAVVWSMQC